MSVAPADYLAAIEHLPAGAVLRFEDVPWEDYENLLADLGEGYAVRIFYDNGRMEVMAPASAHEKQKSAINRLVTALGDELEIDVESLGSTTLKAEIQAKGAEPDDCFYIQSAVLIIGKDDLDLSHDPPPDVVVEIDRTTSSLNKFAIYASLNIPEVWRVAQGRIEFYVLVENRYLNAAVSRAFPFLPARIMTEFLQRVIAAGGRKAAREFREWVRKNQETS